MQKVSSDASMHVFFVHEEKKVNGLSRFICDAMPSHLFFEKTEKGIQCMPALQHRALQTVRHACLDPYNDLPNDESSSFIRRNKASVPSRETTDIF